MRKYLIALAVALLLPTTVFAYTIQRGDTLWNLFGANWKQVADANGITNPRTLQVGQEINTEEMMLGNTNYVQSQYFTTYGAGAVAGATTLVLSSFTQINGTALTMANFGNKGYGTLEPNNGTKEEQLTFTGVTQNANGTATLTGISRQLTVYPYTETSGLASTHTGGVKFVISNTAGFYNTFANQNNTSTITGLWTYNTLPVAQTVTTLPTTSDQFATKYYVDQTAVSGAPNSSETVKGISELATAAELAAGTSSGGTGARLVAPASLFKDHSDGSGDNGKAPVLVGAGKLAQSFINLGDSYTWTNGNQVFNNGFVSQASSTFTATTTVSNLYYGATNGNSLFGNSSTTLHFHVSANGTYATTTNSIGDISIPHTLGIKPTKIRISAQSSYTNTDNYSDMSTGVWNDKNGTGASSTQKMIYNVQNSHSSGDGKTTWDIGDLSGYIAFSAYRSVMLVSVDATNFILRFPTGSGTNVDASILWEAEY